MSSIVENQNRAGRKPGPMSAETKAAMLLKRSATLAKKAYAEAMAAHDAFYQQDLLERAEAALDAAAVLRHAVHLLGGFATTEKKKQRKPMTAEAKSAMAAKRAATIAAKKAAQA